MEKSLPQLILPIKLETSPERLTSLGGLVVLEELARAVGLWEEVDRALEGPKSGRGYRPREFVQPLVWMLHAGGRRLEDLRELRAEQGRARGVRPGGGAGCRDGGGLAASTFRWGCRFALSAPPFGLRRAKRQPQRKPRAKHQEPKQRAKTEETTRKEEPKRDTTKNQQLRWGQIRRSKGAKPG
jgi:hypothetical protein